MPTYTFTIKNDSGWYVYLSNFTDEELTDEMCYQHDDKDMAEIAQTVGLSEQLSEYITMYNNAMDNVSMSAEYEDAEAYGHLGAWKATYGDVPTPDYRSMADDFYDARHLLCKGIVETGGMSLLRAYALCIGVDFENLAMRVNG